MKKIFNKEKKLKRQMTNDVTRNVLSNGCFYYNMFSLMDASIIIIYIISDKKLNKVIFTCSFIYLR